MSFAITKVFPTFKLNDSIINQNSSSKKINTEPTRSKSFSYCIKQNNSNLSSFNNKAVIKFELPIIKSSHFIKKNEIRNDFPKFPLTHENHDLLENFKPKIFFDPKTKNFLQYLHSFNMRDSQNLLCIPQKKIISRKNEKNAEYKNQTEKSHSNNQIKKSNIYKTEKQIKFNFERVNLNELFPNSKFSSKRNSIMIKDKNDRKSIKKQNNQSRFLSIPNYEILLKTLEKLTQNYHQFILKISNKQKAMAILLSLLRKNEYLKNLFFEGPKLNKLQNTITAKTIEDKCIIRENSIFNNTQIHKERLISNELINDLKELISGLEEINIKKSIDNLKIVELSLLNELKNNDSLNSDISIVTFPDSKIIEEINNIEKSSWKMNEISNKDKLLGIIIDEIVSNIKNQLDINKN